MAKIGLFYGSTTGHTEEVCTWLKDSLETAGFIVDMIRVKPDVLPLFEHYDRLILAASTWGYGDLQEDWEAIFDEFSRVNFVGKTVALVGLGDQVTFDAHFADAIGILARCVRQRGGRLIGRWPTEGYSFSKSAAVDNGSFVGLVLDQDNEEHLTPDRIKDWVTQVLSELT